jgi:signal transduction histidine kinase
VRKLKGLRQFKALYSYFLVLVLFLGIGATIPVIQLKGAMEEIARENSLRDLDLLGGLTNEALLRHDYTTVDEYLTHWGKVNPRVTSIKAVAPNGFVIADYEGGGDGGHRIRVSRVLRHGDRSLAVLTLEEDLSVLEREVGLVIRKNIAALLVFTAAMGFFLWVTLQKTAITPVQQLADEVNKLNLTLEERVRDRTADLVSTNEELEREIGVRLRTEAVLKTAKDELERQNLDLRALDKMKDALLRDVSHELKTPVAKHAMQMEILRPLRSNPNLSDEERRALKVMEESIVRQSSVIRNLLDLARLESGGRKYNSEPLHLDELLKKVIDDHRFSIESADVSVSSNVPHISVRSDSEMLWHVFSNLVSNAIKFRRRDEPGKVDISGAAGDGKVTVRIADNGAGMPAEVLQKVFSRFYQATPSVEGSGVGLTICKRIIEDLGGSIRISSLGIGEGTVVEVEIPSA